MKKAMVVQSQGMFARALSGAASAVGKVKALATAAMLALVTAPALAGGGSAASDLGDAATQQLSGAQGIVIGILVTMIGIVFCFTVYKLIKRGAG